jgi:hypothetical protein
MSNESIAIFTSYASIFLSEIFGRTTDHQTGDKDREHNENQHAVKPGANAAEDDFAELNVEQRHEATERGERIVHRIDRTAGGIGCDRGEQCRIEDAEPDFLSFHVAAGNAETLVDWITIRLRPPAQQHSTNKRINIAAQTVQPCF